MKLFWSKYDSAVFLPSLNFACSFVSHSVRCQRVTAAGRMDGGEEKNKKKGTMREEEEEEEGNNGVMIRLSEKESWHRNK